MKVVKNAKILGGGVLLAFSALLVMPATAAYEQVDWIQSSGSQQIVLDFVKLCSTDKVEVKVMFPTAPSSTMCIFACRSGANSKSFSLFAGITSKKFSWHYRSTQSDAIVSETSISDGSDCAVVMDGYNMEFYVDNTPQTVSIEQRDFASANGLMLFASYSSGTATGVANYGSFRFYQMKVWDKDGNLIHDIVPAKDASAAEGSVAQYGVFDKAKGGDFYANSGTAALSAAPDASEPVVLRPLPYDDSKGLRAGLSAGKSRILLLESDDPYVITNQYSRTTDLAIVGVKADGSPADPAKVVIQSDNTDENPASHRFVSTSKTLNLENVTVKGFANTESGDSGIGGALRLSSTGRLFANNCVFSGNSAASGGAVCGTYADGTVVVLDGCMIEGSSGYAFYDWGHYPRSTFSNSTFVANETISYNRLGGSTNSFVGCTFRHNKAAWVSSKTDAGNALSLQSCLSESNTAVAGAWFVYRQNHLEIDSCRFLANTNNTRPMIELQPSGYVRNCLFADNFIASGAGNGSGRSASLVICTGSGHTILNNTFVNNTMPRWCVDQEKAGDTVANNIVKGNVYGVSGKVNVASVWTNNFLSYSISNGAAQGNIGLSADADPGFVDAENGDYSLLKNSICRNAGDNTAWAGVADATDLAGKARVNADDENVVDIGCYEWYSSRLPGMTIFVR